MKLLAFTLILISTSAYPDIMTIRLKASETLNVGCPSGTSLEVNEFNAKCSCPQGEYTNRLEDEIRCESLCVIEEKANPYPTIVVNKRGKILYSERVYSPRKSEYDMLLNEAKEVAAKNCFKTSYNGQYL